jgi:hypothetical protein
VTEHEIVERLYQMGSAMTRIIAYAVEQIVRERGQRIPAILDLMERQMKEATEQAIRDIYQGKGLTR